MYGCREREGLGVVLPGQRHLRSRHTSFWSDYTPADRQLDAVVVGGKKKGGEFLLCCLDKVLPCSAVYGKAGLVI